MENRRRTRRRRCKKQREAFKDEGISNEGNIVAIYYTTCTQQMKGPDMRPSSTP